MDKVLIEHFKSIGPLFAKVLHDRFQIDDVDDFALAVYDGRLKKMQLKMTDEMFNEDLIQQWKEIMDLFRVPTISTRDAEILQTIGINSVEELAHQDPIGILKKMRNLTDKSFILIMQYPSIPRIETWIYYAKLMTRNISYGYGTPLICFFPLIKFAHAIKFQKLRIWTLEEFQIAYRKIPDLRQHIGISQKDWVKILDIIDLIRVDGINLYIATVLYNCGIKSLPILQNLRDLESILEKIDLFQSQGISPEFKITKDLLISCVENSQKEYSFWRGYKWR